jgi:DNA-binding NarL/FixJ family response regulator
VRTTPVTKKPTSRSEAAVGMAYVLLPAEEIPEAWRGRARSLSMIALLPEERRRLLEEGRISPALEPGDQRIVELVARGWGPSRIAAHIGVSTRTVERRLARLRRRFGGRTSAELTALLAATAVAEPGHEASEEAGPRGRILRRRDA